MQKVGIVVARNEAQKVLEKLQKSACFEVSKNTNFSSSALPGSLSKTEAKLADLDFVIRYLASYTQAPQSFREKSLGTKVEGKLTEVESADEKDFSALIETCSVLEEEGNRIRARQSKLEAFAELLSYWEALDVPLEKLRSTEKTNIFLGNVETKEYADFAAEIADTENTYLKEVSHSTRSTFFLLVSHSDSSAQVKHVLENYRFTPVDFGDALGTVSEEIAEIHANEEKNKSRFAEIKAQKKELALQLREVKIAYDALVWKRQKKEALEISSGTTTTTYLTGWVPAKSLKTIKKEIAEVTQYAEVFETEAQEGEAPPVMLKNNAVIKPFENVLGLFGTPAYSEIDPTPFLAPFFAIFFGFCLTDAGYGILMTVTLLIALKVLPTTRDMRQMLVLLLFGGISTIVMGILFGGYFGMTQDQLPFLVNETTGQFYGQVFDPVKDLMPKVAAFAFGLGFLHIVLGVILGFVNKIRNNDTIGAILVHFMELVLIASIAGVILLPAFQTIFSVTLAIACAGIIWGTGPKDSNTFGRIAFGILELFMGVIVGWVANLLSYSRLFSLGLATGVIALAFNSIASTLGGMMPALIGIPVMLLLILFGHSLNIGLNVLGAFVHSGRLQFVEFFGKFLEGGGRKFSPLSRETTYLYDPRHS